MNKYTLKFQNQEFEGFFKNSQHKLMYDIFQTNLKMIIIGFLIGFVTDLVRGKFQLTIFLSILIIFYVFIFFYGRKSKNIFEKGLFMTECLIIVLIPLALHLEIYVLDDISAYLLGQEMQFLFFAMLLDMKFSQKASLLFFNLLFSYILMVIKQQTFSSYRTILLGLSFLMINDIYCREKESREIFQLKNERTQWNKGLDSVIGLATFQCNYDRKKQKIILEKFNKPAQQRFLKTFPPQSFKNLIRKTIILRPKISIEQQNTDKMMDQGAISLEKFIFYLNEKPQLCQEFLGLPNLVNLFQTNYSISGIFNKNSLNIQIFATYDEKMEINIMITKLAQKNENKVITQKLQFATKVIDKLVSKIEKFTHQSLLIVQKMKDSLTSKITRDKIGQITKFMKPSLSALNLRLQVIDMHNRNVQIIFGTLQSIETKCFTLKDVISDMINQFELILQYKKISLELLYDNQIKEITSSPLLIRHLLSNLIFNSICYSPMESNIKLEINQNYSKEVNQQLIKFQITDEAGGLNQQTLDNLPIIRCEQFDELIRMNKAIQPQLGLVTSNYLINRLGPKNEILIKYDDHGKKFISFYLFSDLSLIIAKQKRLKTYENGIVIQTEII